MARYGPLHISGALFSIPRGTGPRWTWNLVVFVWATKRLRGYLQGTKIGMLSDHKALESIG